MQGEALDPEQKPPAGTSGRKPTGGPGDGRGKERDMGDALRSVYDRTVQEAVPDDLLDLLSKLD